MICEIMNDDGTMARVPDLMEFCDDSRDEDADGGGADSLPHGARALCEAVGEALVEPRYGEFRMIAYESEVDAATRTSRWCSGDIENGREPVLVRMHCALPDGGRVRVRPGASAETPLKASLEAHCRGRSRRVDLSPSDFEGLFGRKSGREADDSVPSGAVAPTLPESQRQTQREIGLGLKSSRT